MQRPELLELAHALKEKSRRALLPFIMWTKPDYDPGWLHHVVCKELDQFLQDVHDKKSPRLMLFAPPRHGKSEIVSRRFPAYAFGRYPDLKMIATSYSNDLSSAMNRDVQKILDSPAYIELFPGTRLGQSAVRTVTRAGSALRNSEEFEIVGTGGAYKSAGVGTGITGRGGHVLLCLPAGTTVSTSVGEVAIENLGPTITPHYVLSLNQEEKRLEYKKLVSWSSSTKPGIYRITTTAGKVVEATGNHPLYTLGGFTRADHLAPGDSLLCLVQSEVCENERRGAEAHAQRLCGSLLQGSMYTSAPCGEELTSVRYMRRAGEREAPEVLQGVPAFCASEAGQATCTSDHRTQMSGVQREVRILLSHLLHETVRQYRALKAYVWNRQPEVEARSNTSAPTTALGQGIPGHASVGAGARQLRMCTVHGHRHAVGGASSRQRPDELGGVESGNTVLEVSPCLARGEGFQAFKDTVATIEVVREETVVYDIEVADNHTFFANGVCVHNCDDPVKDAQEAYSATTRESVWNWYLTTLKTRCEPGGGILLIMTRWHSDDLAGRILKQMERGGEQWRVVRFPAIAEEDETYRSKGEALHPHRYNLQTLNAIRFGSGDDVGTGSRVWNALYQQRPSSAEGTIFLDKHWQFIKNPPPGLLIDHDAVNAVKRFFEIERIIQYWDTAAGGKQHNDFAACVTLGVCKARYIVLDVFKKKMEFPELKRAVQMKYDEWRPSQVGIEGGGSSTGKSVIQELSRDTRIPFLEITHSTDKVLRANVVSPIHEADKVCIREGMPWAADFVASCGAFPSALNDDDVDAFIGTLEMVTQARKPMKISDELLANI